MPNLDPAVLHSLTDRLAGGRGVAPGDLPAPLLDVVVEDVALRGAAPVRVLRPRVWEDLRHEEGGAGRAMPWWARLWSSGRALAEAVALAPPAAGTRVLELGCGLGLPSVVAARGGADVLATDGAEDAVAFMAATLALNEATADIERAEWATDADATAPAERADLASDGEALVARGPFDRVLAADVLYREQNVPALLAVLPRLLAPGGAAWIADPGRAFAERFVDAARVDQAFATVTTEHRGGDVQLHRLTTPA